VRETNTSQVTPWFHEQAKKWAISVYGDEPSLTEEEWHLILDEDSQHPYKEYPTTKPSPLVNPFDEEVNPLHEVVIGNSPTFSGEYSEHSTGDTE